MWKVPYPHDNYHPNRGWHLTPNVPTLLSNKSKPSISQAKFQWFFMVHNDLELDSSEILGSMLGETLVPRTALFWVLTLHIFPLVSQTWPPNVK
jgi:hypothetical protein